MLHVCIEFRESGLCKYFERAVMPDCPEVIKIFHKDSDRVKTCELCGREFIPKSSKPGLVKYCPECARKVYKRQQAEYARKRRSRSRK